MNYWHAKDQLVGLKAEVINPPNLYLSILGLSRPKQCKGAFVSNANWRRLRPVIFYWLFTLEPTRFFGTVGVKKWQ